MNDSVATLVSVRPRYAEKIYSGEKRVELRKVRPPVSAGSLVLLYESAPIKALTGLFVVGGLESEAPPQVWAKYSGCAGVTREEFFSYFGQRSVGHAISIEAVRPFAHPIPLRFLASLWGGFHPPQVHRFVSLENLRDLADAFDTVSQQLESVRELAILPRCAYAYNLCR